MNLRDKIALHVRRDRLHPAHWSRHTTDGSARDQDREAPLQDGRGDRSPYLFSRGRQPGRRRLRQDARPNRADLARAPDANRVGASEARAVQGWLDPRSSCLGVEQTSTRIPQCSYGPCLFSPGIYPSVSRGKRVGGDPLRLEASKTARWASPALYGMGNRLAYSRSPAASRASRLSRYPSTRTAVSSPIVR